MSVLAQQIDDLSAAAEHRGGRDARKGDGAFFTADDVARWLARRAICRAAFSSLDVHVRTVDAWLADGADLHERLRELLRARGADTTRVRRRIATLRVLDPTCGAGAFLVAAWQELTAVQAVLDDVDGSDVAPRVHAAQLHGVDLDAGAVTAARDVLALVAGPGACILQGNALDGVPTQIGRVDVLLGNPPYVRAAVDDAPRGLRSAAAGNLAAWIVERALASCAPDASLGMVLPVAVASSDRWGGLRAAWDEQCSSVHAAHFDTIPSTLFPGVVQRLTLLEGVVATPTTANAAEPARWHSTRYHRWRSDERVGLLDRVRHVALDAETFRPATDPIPKLGSDIELELLRVLDAHPAIGRWFVADGGAPDAQRLRYKRRWSYFLLFTDFVPPIWDADGAPREPSELQSIAIDPRVDVRVPVAVLSSTLFWWWFSVFTDNRNVNRGELARFAMPLLDAEGLDRLTSLGAELMEALEACGEVRTCTYKSVGTIRNTYYRQAATRPVIDRIDVVLADLLGLDDVQRRTILDYERRFRS